ncbi:MAG: hypothetical protein RLZZ553_1187 [Verrucomicrobiota bacterium]|jgi:hypothetical protein
MFFNHSILVKILSLLAVCFCSASLAADFYVDPVSGNNANNGASPATAFKTIEKARNAVRLINANMTEDNTIHLRGGTHRLSTTLTLGPSDSGTNGFVVVYRNYSSEVPIISGGVNLSGGWVIHDAVKNIYKKTGVNFTFRQLTVNSSSTIRARTPNQTNPDTLGPYLTMIGIDAAAKEADGKLHERPSPIFFWEFSIERLMSTKPQPYIDPNLQQGTTPLVKRSSGKNTRDFQNFHYHSVHAADRIGPRAIISDNHKLVIREKKDKKTMEMYDLEIDPAEKSNIIDQKPQLARKMQSDLDHWQDSVLQSLTGADYLKK